MNEHPASINPKNTLNDFNGQFLVQMIFKEDIKFIKKLKINQMIRTYEFIEILIFEKQKAEKNFLETAVSDIDISRKVRKNTMEILNKFYKDKNEGI